MADQLQRALLFMPDISGFTQFVTATEITHSQHIVQELLEILVETNDLGLEVQEIEGDAIFFYKIGDKHDLDSVLKQVEKMFIRFHRHLKLYDHQRICLCGACKTTVDLKLKVIVHFGEVTGITVKNHRKLFGKDVIVLHRLLKNNLDKKEYVLFTDSFLSGASSPATLPGWYSPMQGKEEYDLGVVDFSFSDLSPLHDVISAEDFPGFISHQKTYSAFTKEDKFDNSMAEIFETIISLQEQSKLISGTKKLQPVMDTDIIKIGTKHSCLITRNNNENITEVIKIEPEKIEMIEMSVKGRAGYRYLVEKISESETNLSVSMLVKDDPISKFGFNLIYKAKMMKRVEEFLLYLKSYLTKATVAYT